jgi:hypothetical protein
MSSYDPSLFNTSPYYDDFNEDKKFLRMLFRPGYAVQSRELTQLQTILQNQIERFGNHVFKDGSRIIGGEVSTQTLNFLRIKPDTYAAPVLRIAPSDVVGYNLIQRGATGETDVRAKVVDYLEYLDTNDPYGVAVVSYLSGSQFSAGATLECDNPDVFLQIQVPTTNDSGIASEQYTGSCKVVGVNDGIYYINGFFVKATSQFEPAYNIGTTSGVRNFSNPNGSMGFELKPMIVTEKEDYTLKDPANGSYNYNAPGAHRFKIDPTLKFVESLADEDFIELVRYENGVITKKNEESEYSELVKLFAQRTYDESGNYIVRPFDISFRNGSGNTFFADIGSGKAYVFGYEYETKFKDVLQVPKGRTTKQYTDLPITNYFGNYVVGTHQPSLNQIATSLNELFSGLNSSLGQQTRGYLVYGATGAADGGTLTNAVFTARLVGIDLDLDADLDASTEVPDGLTIKYHLMDVQYPNSITQVGLDSGATANLYMLDQRTNVSTKIGHNLNKKEDVSTSRYIPEIYDTQNQSLVYAANEATPTTVVKNIDELQYIHRVSRGFAVSADNPQPTVFLNQGVEFDWCLANGTVPSGVPIQIDESDGYFLVYVSGSGFPIGTTIRIVSNAFTVQNGATKITAQITADGDAVKFTTNLPVGGYFLVGKSKNNSENIASSPDPVAKMRVKTGTAATEIITNTTATLNSYKRVIKRNSSDAIYEMYFVLDRADVWKINSIVSGSTDISNRFLFDNGQRDYGYELARLYVKPEYFGVYGGTSTFTMTINYSYFTHSGYGPFTVESYRGISYDQIPIFVSPTTGKSIHLANAIDFRYIAQIEGYITSGATSGTVAAPGPTGNSVVPVLTYSNGFAPEQFTLKNTNISYLPRIDKVVVSKNTSLDGTTTTIQRIAGNPSDSPIVPEDLGDSMTLFVLNIPAYTFKATDVRADTIGNSRFTMKDIGGISKRVDSLEQYAVLSDLELDIIGKNLKLIDGVTEAIKKAIIVDSFDGHSVADVANREHQCSIDIERGELRPFFVSDAYEFRYNGGDAGITLTTDGILCYNFTKYGTPILAQERASETIKVNPFDLPNWVGNMVITPHADYWYDNENRPVVKSNEEGMNDAWLSSNMNDREGHGSQWNDWESIWTGISVELTDAESKKNSQFFSKPRNAQTGNVVGDRFVVVEGIERNAKSLEQLKEMYTADFRKKNFYNEVALNTLVNKSVVPTLRGGKTITFSAYNLKPNTQVSIFFDNVNVNALCTNVSGNTGPFKTNALDGSLVNISMTIPSETFEVGEKILRVIDDPNNVVENATTIAEGIYYATGIKNDDFTSVVSIRPSEIRKQTPNSSKVVSNPLFRDRSINTAVYNQWIDPLTQTFEINQNFYPNGLYLESVDLFVASKDKYLPLTVEIHPVVAGVPHPAVVLPFSTVVKNPSAISDNAVTPTATNFKFSTPVYLAPGQYALVVKANSSDYSLFVGNIGQYDIISNERISSTFNGGVLFKPQNSSEQVGDASTDLMFNLNRCSFSNPATTTITLNHYHNGVADNNNATLVQPNPAIFIPPGVAVGTKVQIATDVYDAIANRNLPLPQKYEIDETEVLDLILTPSVVTTGLLTPMVDMQKTNVVVVESLIDNSDSTTQETSPYSGRANSKVARYITKNVSLPVGETARELKVLLDLNVPTGSFVRVYGKAFSKSGINQESYALMTLESPDEFSLGGEATNSLTKFDFREAVYALNPGFEFDTFAVKIVMYSTDASKIPVAKNLRVVALE